MIEIKNNKVSFVKSSVNINQKEALLGKKGVEFGGFQVEDDGAPSRRARVKKSADTRSRPFFTPLQMQRTFPCSNIYRDRNKL